MNLTQNPVNLFRICSAGPDILINFVPRGLIPRCVLFSGVWYQDKIWSAGTDTLSNFVLRGLIPWRILFREYKTHRQIRTPRSRTKEFRELSKFLKQIIILIGCYVTTVLPKATPSFNFFLPKRHQTPGTNFRIQISWQILNGNQK